MNIEEKLRKQFKETSKVFIEKENNFNFLRIETNLRKLSSIEKLSKEISNYLDEQDPFTFEYYLDIYSPGTDEEIDKSKLDLFIGTNVEIILNKKIRTFLSFIGEILEADQNECLIKWNAKGQFRKQVISITNIKSVKKYTKIEKRK